MLLLTADKIFKSIFTVLHLHVIGFLSAVVSCRFLRTSRRIRDWKTETCGSDYRRYWWLIQTV